MIKVTFAVLGLACISNAQSATTNASSSTPQAQNYVQKKSVNSENRAKMAEAYRTLLNKTMGPVMRPGIKNPRCIPYPECRFRRGEATLN